ncbi:MAG: helix-turn-helix transcriptional regulator [Clostridia bacterium]|nr:helix-turn-helix transcriptional regulator [Clostridia bacterium]
MGGMHPFLRISRRSFQSGRIFAPYQAYPRAQIAYVEKGYANWRIGEQLYHIREGDLLILSEVDYRQFDPLKPGVTLTLLLLQVLPPRAFSQDCTLFYLRPKVFSNLLDPDNPHTVSARNLMLELSTLLFKSDLAELDEACASAIFSLMLVHLRYLMESGQSIPDQSHYTMLLDCYRHVAANYTGDLSVSSIAAALYCSPEHLSRTFHRLSGMRLSDYIRRVRVQAVLRMLEQDGCGILDAAFACGFRSASGFYKAFHSETGMRPREYLQRS